MTDMRATERLLEVIGELNEMAASVLPVIAGAIANGNTDLVRTSLSAIERCTITSDEAVTELRRRGDTLVRRDDLAIALDAINQRAPDVLRLATPRQAIERLENAIGGKP